MHGRKRKNWFASKKVIGIAIVILIVLGVGSVWQFSHSRRRVPGYSGSVERISTGLIGEYAALVLIAQNQGYFKASGLEVDIKDYPSGPAALNDLLKGDIDLAMASDFAGVSNSFMGQPLKILATVSKSEAFYMIALKSHGITNVSDLKGKRIGITRKTVGEFYLGQFLTFNNLSLKDIVIVDMPQAELVKAVTNGKVDSAVLFEPNAYHANEQLGTDAVRWSVQTGQSIFTVLYGTEKLLHERPQIIERYLRATLEAERFIKNNPDEARKIIAERLKYDQAYTNYIWSKFEFNLSLEQELLINMDDEARWSVDNHLTTAPKIPNYFNLIDFTGLDAVKPESITVIR